MKRQVTVYKPVGSKNLRVENRILNGSYPSDADMKDVVEVSEEDYLESIKVKPTTSLLPPGVRWMSADGNSLIIEEQPSHKTIRMRWGARDAFTVPLKNYRLPMPHLVYGISPDSNSLPHVSHIYATTEGVKSWKTRLYWLPIPNTWENGAICTHTLLREQDIQVPYHWLINLAIEEFWSSIFNLDVEAYEGNGVYQKMCEVANHIDYDEYGETVTGPFFDEPYRYWESLEMDQVWWTFDGYWHAGRRLSDLKNILLNNNHQYSFGGSDSERLMATMIAKSYENTVV